MGLPVIKEFEKTFEFGGSAGQSRSRYIGFLAWVSCDNDDDMDAVVGVIEDYVGVASPHPTDAGFFASDISVDPHVEGVNSQGHYCFRVMVTYGANVPINTANEDDPYQRAENPLDDPVIWHSSFRLEYVVAEKDRFGNAILNSAGDFYDPPPMKRIVVWTHSITQNFAIVPASLTNWAGAVNNAPVTIRGTAGAVGTVAIMGMDIPSQSRRNGVNYVPVTITYEVDPRGYDLSLLDQGFREIKSGKQVDIYVESPDDPEVKERASSPVLLNGMGQKIISPSPLTAVFRSHEINNRLAFAGLPGINT